MGTKQRFGNEKSANEVDLDMQYVTVNAGAPFVLLINGKETLVQVIHKPLSREELANVYGVEPRTVDTWKAKRWIPYTKIRGVIRFDLAEVREALDRQFKIRARR